MTGPANDDLRLTVPSRGEGVAGWSSQVIGGPVGRYAAVGRRGISYSVTVLSALASVMVALGALSKAYCISNGWGAPDSLWRTCYSDLAVGLTTEGGPWAKGSAGDNQPVLTAVLHWVIRQITPDGSTLAVQQYYFAFGAVVIALSVAAAVIALAGALRDTPWLAAHLALSPVLITASLVSFDAFGVALATIGLVLWLRDNSLAAGVLLGAAVMARTYPLIIVAAIVLVALRDRRTADLTRLLAAGTAVVVVCFGVAHLAGGDPFTVYRTWNAAAPGYGSPWFVLTLLKVPVAASTATWLVVAGWVLALLVGVYLVRRPRHLTPLPPLALTMLVIVMATGKTFPVQQALWILPLLALTAVRWREHLLWAGVEVAYFVLTMLYIASRSDVDKGVPAALYLVFALIRLIAWGAITWISWETAEELQDFHDPDGAARHEEWTTRQSSTAADEGTGFSTGDGRDSLIVSDRL